MDPSARPKQSDYKQLTSVQHILQRPDTYIGSPHPRKTDCWVAAVVDGKPRPVWRSIMMSPGMFKIFDEVLVNAVDNAQRGGADSGTRMTYLKVRLEPGKPIVVENDGFPILVEYHDEYKCWIPEMLFARTRTSTNYDDTQQRTTGGRNGLGGKAANVFSSLFRVECCDGYHTYWQEFRDHLSTTSTPVVREVAAGTPSAKPYTRITFMPDFSAYGIPVGVPADMLALFTRRVWDSAGVLSAFGVTVSLNGRKVAFKSFQDYAGLYCQPRTKRLVHEAPGWTIVVGAPMLPTAEPAAPEPEPPAPEPPVMDEDDIVAAVNLKRPRPGSRPEAADAANTPPPLPGQEPVGDFARHMTFVNGVSTWAGGSHLDAVLSQVVSECVTVLKKKVKGSKPTSNMIAARVFVCISAYIPRPEFESQTKSRLETPAKQFAAAAELPRPFLEELHSSSMVAAMVDKLRGVQRDKMLDAVSAVQGRGGGMVRPGMTGVPKLDDAEMAGVPGEAEKCTLILTEGDSAKALAVAGLSVVGRRYYGVMPLKGKGINTTTNSTEKVSANQELKNIITALGIVARRVYTDRSKMRYGHVMIMADQDTDGSHIKGLLLNMFRELFPSLLQLPGFLQQFITPLIKATRGGAGGAKHLFYSSPEFNAWREAQGGADALRRAGWSVKYYKGLGTSTTAEAKEYFANIEFNRVTFVYEPDGASEHALNVAFGKDANLRKEWLLTYDPKRPVPGISADRTLPISQFVNHELIHFSMDSNIRCMPCVLDGLKESQRKVIMTAKRVCANQAKSMKVASIAGSVTIEADFHHGEDSTCGTIVNIAQSFVGSGNNVPLMVPQGIFGSRQNHKPSQSRYIFSYQSSLCSRIYAEADEPILSRRKSDDGKDIEPWNYLPIIPMVLVNDTNGIGTGWSVSIPPHNPLHIIDYLLAVCDAGGPADGPRPEFDALPYYLGFKGTVHRSEDRRSWSTHGVWERDAADPLVIHVLELPAEMAIDSFVEHLNQLVASKHVEPGFKQASSENCVYVWLKLSSVVAEEPEADPSPKPAKRARKDATGAVANPLEDEYVWKLLHLRSTKLYQLNLFNSEHRLHQYPNMDSMMQEYITHRFRGYTSRIQHLIGVQEAHLAMVQTKLAYMDLHMQHPERFFHQEEDAIFQFLEDNGIPRIGGSFDFLDRMGQFSSSSTKLSRLRAERDRLVNEIDRLRSCSEWQMWRSDLVCLRDAIIAELPYQEAPEDSPWTLSRALRVIEQDNQAVGTVFSEASKKRGSRAMRGARALSTKKSVPPE